MAKFNAKKIQECEEWIAKHGLMEYGGASLKSYCEAMGIHHTSHFKWLKSAEYQNALDSGKLKFKQTHTKKLFGTLMEAAMGGERETEEENTEYRPGADGQPQIHRMLRHKRKQYQKPDTVAAIFLLCNLDPEHWRQRQDNNVTVKKTEEENSLSLEEINDEIKRLTEE